MTAELAARAARTIRGVVTLSGEDADTEPVGELRSLYNPTVQEVLDAVALETRLGNVVLEVHEHDERESYPLATFIEVWLQTD
jgi:hypothetical protein